MEIFFAVGTSFFEESLGGVSLCKVRDWGLEKSWRDERSAS